MDTDHFCALVDVLKTNSTLECLYIYGVQFPNLHMEQFIDVMRTNRRLCCLEFSRFPTINHELDVELKRLLEINRENPPRDFQLKFKDKGDVKFRFI